MMELTSGASETNSQLEAAFATLFPMFQLMSGLAAIESTLEDAPRWALATLLLGVLTALAGAVVTVTAGLPAVELSDVVMCFHTFTGP